jgi:hypothetical protein
VVRDALTNPALAEVRLDYADRGDTRFALVNNRGRGLLWPEGYTPAVPGYTALPPVEEGEARDDRQPPLLGLRLDKYDLAAPDDNPHSGQIVVYVLHAGGRKGREETQILSGTRLHYRAKLDGKRWVAEFLSLSSP